MRIITSFLLSGLILYITSVYSAHAETGDYLDYHKIENLTGLKGEYDVSGDFKISVPHHDLKVSTTGVLLTPTLGMTSWATFKKHDEVVEVDGELVLTEDQANSVLKSVLENNLNVTALNNHYLWDSPKIMFMKFEGNGAIDDLAPAIEKVFESVKKTRRETIFSVPIAHIDTTKTVIDFHNIEAILRVKGTMNNGVFKVVFDQPSSKPDEKMGSVLGSNSWVAFAGSNKQAAMLGVFGLQEGEVQNVLKKLMKHQILVQSLYQQKMGENGRLFFVHYVKQGPAVELAENLKDVIEFAKEEKTNVITVENLPEEEIVEEKNDRLKRIK